MVRVPVPVPTESMLAAAGSVGLGYLDALRGQPDAVRGFGGVALAYSPLPELSVGVDLSGRGDAFADGLNLYGEPRLAARFATELSRDHFIGAGLDARFVGAEAPSVEWQATSSRLGVSYGLRVAKATWVAAEVGFELDRTARAVPRVERISPTDERTLAASSWSNVPLGVGVVHAVHSTWQVMAEVTGQWLVGSQAPGVSRSPWRVTGGVRHRVNAAWSAQAGVDVALSSRGPIEERFTLPREPRIAGFFALMWTPRQQTPSAAPIPAKAVAVPETKAVIVGPETPPPQPTTPVVGTLVDEGGRPLVDAEVVLVQDGAELARERTTAHGQFTFPAIPLGSVVLRVVELGYDALESTIAADQERRVELVLRPAVPAGQVRGKVLDLYGNPVMARVTVNPGALDVPVASDGAFELDLAPGRYTVRFEHPNFAPQRRTIVVKNRGVVILNIGLLR